MDEKNYNFGQFFTFGVVYSTQPSLLIRAKLQ